MTVTAKRYIFTFKEGTKEDSEAAKKARDFIKSQGKHICFSATCPMFNLPSITFPGGKIIHDYGETGFSAEVPIKDVSIATNFESNELSDAVEAVEEDGVVTVQ